MKPQTIYIQVTTAPGKAKKFEPMFRAFTIGILKRPDKIWLAPEHDKIIWQVTDKPKKIQKFIRKGAMFEATLRYKIMNYPLIRHKYKRFTKEEKKEFDGMLAATQVNILTPEQLPAEFEKPPS